MERRVLLAVILSFIVLYGYQALFPPAPDQAKPPAPAPSSKTATAPNAAAPEASNPAPSIQPAAPLPAESGVPAAPVREVAVENADVRGVFTSRGGVLKSWQLKKYRDDQGRPFDIIAGHAPPDSPLPFTLATDDAALSALLASAPFTVTDSTGADGSWRAVFEYAGPAGVKAQKVFSVAPAMPYVINVSASLSRDGQALPVTLRWGPALGSGIKAGSNGYNPAPQPIFFRDGTVTRVAPDKIAQQAVQEGAFGFAGVDDHYFLTSVVKPDGIVRLQYAAVTAAVPNRPEGAHYVDWSSRSTSAVTAKYFAGPKDFDVLTAVDRDLTRAIHFGVFAWIVVPLLRALKWINGYVGNYGWSIVLLTVFINLMMFPLRHKSVVSMRKMQDIQPEMKAIQKRYEGLKMGDPARAKQNQEQMDLFKARGVNPASGCVPMILTIPVLYAFYSMLSVAIELRGAPFVFWIHDLSAPDPLYIFPVLMGASMFIQQKMTPMGSVDPVQQKMMLFMMPIMMTVFMLSAASGLLIYWTASNIWGIGQQMVTNKLIGPATVRTVRPPAERQMKGVKSVGGGKTDQAKERNS